jgi:hypothetical protein
MNIMGWQSRYRMIKHPLRPAHWQKLNYESGSKTRNGSGVIA